MSIYKDINNKVSSKRIIAYLSFFWALVLSMFIFFKGIGDIRVMYAFLGVAGGNCFACSFERKI